MSDSEVERLSAQLAAARARLAAFESRAVPYSREELALFRKPAAPAPRVETRAASTGSTRTSTSAARPLLVEATRDFDQRRFAEAESKFTQALALDERQLITLGNLAATQLEQDKLDDAEATLRRALALAPEDAATVALLGLLRFRQDRMDDALDAASRAAQLDPKNAETQNLLGLTFARKSQRVPAETAFRKALQLQPNFGRAHYNLAVFYSTTQPPTMELARWHYQKALANGASANPELERTLAAEK